MIGSLVSTPGVVVSLLVLLLFLIATLCVQWLSMIIKEDKGDKEKCGGCGGLIRPGAKFCHECGCRVEIVNGCVEILGVAERSQKG